MPNCIQVLFFLQCTRLEGFLDKLSWSFAKLTNRLELYFDFPPDCKFEVQITDEPEINACARWEEASSTYYVEFTLGMIVWLDGVSATLASHVSRDFEDAPHPPLLLDPQDKNWRATYQKRLDLSTEHLPEEYFGAYESFFQKAVVAIFAHEFSHIARGHLDWQNAKSGTSSISERGLRKTGASISSDQTRALEFDADMFAAKLVAFLATEPPDCLPRWQRGTATENLIESLLGLTLFFVSVEAENEQAGTSTTDYPKPLLRMIVMLTYMDEIWSTSHPEGDFWLDVFGGALEVLKLFETLYPEIDLLRSLNDMDINAAIKQEVNEVSDHLQNLQDEVLEFAFEGKGSWQFEIE